MWKHVPRARASTHIVYFYVTPAALRISLSKVREAVERPEYYHFVEILDTLSVTSAR